MIRLLCKLPKDINIAVSGGVDSMAALDFLSRRHNVNVAFFHHRTETSYQAYKFLVDYCSTKSLKLSVGFLSRNKDKDESYEEFWRIERYKFLNSLDGLVVTAHHLDDAVETWVWSSMHGNPALPNIKINNVVRPFLLTAKEDLVSWATRKNVPWIEDESNNNTAFTRNYIRHELMPKIKIVNPGIATVIKKKIIEKSKNYEMV